jgi:hypothetical protein
MFEKASRLKLRFEFNKGLLSTEDLWGLSLDSLDNLARSVNKKLKESQEESFINRKSKSDSELELKLNILKRVIEYKLDKAEKLKARSKVSEERRVLMDILAQKDLENKKNMSQDDILKRLNELDSKLEDED